MNNILHLVSAVVLPVRNYISHEQHRTLEAAVEDVIRKGIASGRQEMESEIRASGRLAPEVDGSAVKAARRAAILACENAGAYEDDLIVGLDAAMPIIAAAAEAKAREECAVQLDRIADDLHRKWRLGHKADQHMEGQSDGVSSAAAAIRTGAAS